MGKMKQESYFKKLYDIINETEKNGLLIRPDSVKGFHSDGLSGEKLLGALQRFTVYQNKTGGGTYLEIGIFQGLSLISIAKVLETVEVYGIDNFSDFDPDGLNKKIVLERLAANKLTNAVIIERDFEEALLNIKDYIGNNRIGVFFVDGPHDYRSQLVSLMYAKQYILSETGIIVVDDCNNNHVRQANRDFLISNPEFKLFYEAYTKSHPIHMNESDKCAAQKGWWNGVNIIVKDNSNILDQMLPQTMQDRCLFYNSHKIHGAKYGKFIPELLDIFNLLNKSDDSKILKELKTLKTMQDNSDYKKYYQHDLRNTNSAELSPGRFNSVIKNILRY